MERLQKILSARGVCSRRQAEALIEAGRVTCNGAKCKLGDTADADKDLILVDGKPLPSKGKSVYIMLNKPKGYVTTLSDEKNRKNVAQLVAQCGARVYPVGRLDMDSEGLLLFTNDASLRTRNWCDTADFVISKSTAISQTQSSLLSKDHNIFIRVLSAKILKKSEISETSSSDGICPLTFSTVFSCNTSQSQRLLVFFIFSPPFS